MQIGDIMNTNIVTVESDEQADAAWSLMDRHRIRHLVVTDSRDVVGVISERDLGGRSGESVREGRTVADLMTEKIVTGTPDTTLRQAANMMRGRLVGCLPILDEGKLVGIITATDVLDELGRGAERPALRAKRRDIRLHAGATFLGGRKKKRTPSSSATSRNNPDLGRTRKREAQSKARVPLPKRVSRVGKETRGTTSAAKVPAYIRAVGLKLDGEDRAYLRRKLGAKLGPFASSIERVSVRVEDVNGPRGGKDKSCRIKVVLRGLPSVVVEQKHASLQAAMDKSLGQVQRAVRKALEKRQTLSVKNVA